MTSQIWPLVKRAFAGLNKPRQPLARIAVLIDADGISPKGAEPALKQIPSLGRICILRTYGNFAGGASTWAKVIKTHGAVARHMPSVAMKKNAADIALCIDAVEILLTRRIDTFVIIASDSDFTPLARRIAEEGKDIFGFGQKSTPTSFRNACTRFQELHTLAPARQPAAPLWSLEPADAEDVVLPILQKLCADGQPVELTTLGQRLARTICGFDTRTYRRRNLTDLLRDLPSVELLEVKGKRLVRPARPQIRTG